jgi:hypothetical protein
MPIYDKSNLVDFNKKLVWMRSVQLSKIHYPKINLPDTLFILACILVVFVMAFTIYNVWI